MAEKVKMNTSEIEGRVEKLSKIKEKYEAEILKPITNLEEEMKSIWVGDSCSAYSDSMYKYKKVFDSVIDIIDSTIQQMNKTVDFFKEQDKELSKSFKKNE
ncbi:MAG: hypothetical protein ABF289_03670 [Clostridiales bacterium]